MARGPHISAETQGKVRRITLDRPESGNRVTEPVALAFIDAVHGAIEDDDVSVVVIAGSGSVFSLGAEATLAEIGPGSAARRGVAAALLPVRDRRAVLDEGVVVGVDGRLR